MIEKLKSALEALVKSTGELHRHYSSPTDMQIVMNHRAITDLRTVIAQLEKAEPVAYRFGYSDGSTIFSDTPYGEDAETLSRWTPLYAAPVQPVVKESLTTQVQPKPPEKFTVTLQDYPVDIELAQYKRMFEAACVALGEIGDALGCDPNEGGADPILYAIAELKVVQPKAEPLTDEQIEMLNFLYGSGELDGVWFDEPNPKRKGTYWWRTELRDRFPTEAANGITKD